MTGLRAVPLSVHAQDAGQLAARLGELPDDIGAIYLTHTDPVRARAAQRSVHEAGGVAVVTEQDSTAVALSAVLLTVLARVDRAPRSSQVVIAGAQSMPLLADLLMAAGIGDIISWNPADRTGFRCRSSPRTPTPSSTCSAGSRTSPAPRPTARTWP